MLILKSFKVARENTDVFKDCKFRTSSIDAFVEFVRPSDLKIFAVFDPDKTSSFTPRWMNPNWCRKISYLGKLTCPGLIFHKIEMAI